MVVTSNADTLAAQYRRIAAQLSAALQRGLLQAMSAVETAAMHNLSGSGVPFSYPVPVRTRFLLQSLGTHVASPTAVEIFDSAPYARAVHEGVFSQWAGRGKTRIVQRPARPFLTDALETAQPTEMIAAELAQVFDT